MKPTNPYYDNYAKQAIIESLLKLMKTTPLEKITITDITNMAQVARRTFYLYYSTKQDVLIDYYDVISKEYDALRENEYGLSSPARIEQFFRFCSERREFLKLLYDQHLFHMLLRHFNAYLARRASMEGSVDRDKFEFAYSAAGLWAVLYVWTDGGFQEPPAQLAATVWKMKGGAD